MLGSLIATLIICVGVANTTPICNYAKNEEQTRSIKPKKQVEEQYEITLTRSNPATATFQNQPTDTYIQRGIDYEVKYNIAANSNYLSVIGTEYQTQVYYEDNNSNKEYSIQNYETWQLGQASDYCLMQSYMIKITPYNFNTNTWAKISLQIYINDRIDHFGNQTIIDQRYMIRNVYTTTHESWDAYINKQLTYNISATIENDIIDINNGFYYSLDQLIWQTNAYNGPDEFEIEITPSTTTYIFIQYIPMIKASYYDFNNDETTDYGTTSKAVPLRMSGINFSTLRIAGTNIVPTGSYEVIDIPGLMFEIIGMPFAFVSQAFNLTLFPGTPYQINIANLFLSIMAVLIFVWIITIVIKIKSGG